MASRSLSLLLIVLSRDFFYPFILNRPSHYSSDAKDEQ